MSAYLDGQYNGLSLLLTIAAFLAIAVGCAYIGQRRNEQAEHDDQADQDQP